MMLGSIPQQDVFQRVMSAKNVKRRHARPGDRRHLLHPVRLRADVPRDQRADHHARSRPPALLKDDPQKVLPTLVLDKMPFVMQVLFFGALLSAIKSTASATLLAPSVTFVENIWRQFCPRQSDRQRAARPCASRCWCSAPACCAYAIAHAGHADLRAWCPGAYQVHAGRRLRAAGRSACTGSAPPPRARSSPSCWASLTWLLFLATPAGEAFPGAAGRALMAVRRDGGRIARPAGDPQQPRLAPHAGRRGLSGPAAAAGAVQGFKDRAAAYN